MAAAPNRNDAWHQWAYGVLNGIGAPINQTNLDTLWNWSIKESGQNVMRWNNPLNTTQNAPGATSQNSVGVKSYPDVTTGIAATTQTLTNGRYPNIVDALKQSVPTSQWSASPAIVKQLGTWGSGANWLSWKNKAPISVNSQLLATGGSQVTSSGTGNPIQDAINSALSPIGNAITGAEQSFVKVAINITLMAMGGGLMLAGLALLAVALMREAPAPVRQIASAAANLTPQGRAVSVARAVTPAKAAPAVPAAAPAKPALSPQAQASVAAARAGRGSKLSPQVKSELRRAS